MPRDCSLSVRKLAVLDAARIAAAIWVLTAHALALTNRYVPLISQGQLAVDVFIVISGFFMCMVLETEGQVTIASATRFYLRRYFRIAPLFYFAVCLYVCFRPYYREGIGLVERAFGSDAPMSKYIGPVQWSDVIAHLTFTHGILPTGQASRIFGPAWTLSLEMQFYVVAPYFIDLMKRRPWAWLAVVFAVNVVFNKLFGVYEYPGWIADYWFPSALPARVMLFALGAIACRFATTRSARDLGLLAATIACCQFVYTRYTMAPCIALIGIFFLLYLSTNARVTRLNRFFSVYAFVLLAEWSYGIYLLHQFAVAIVGHLLFHGGAWPIRRLAVIAFYGSLMGVTLLMSILLFYIIEAPLRTVGRRLAARIAPVGYAPRISS